MIQGLKPLYTHGVIYQMSKPTQLSRLRRRERNFYEERNGKQKAEETGQGEKDLRIKELTRIITRVTSGAS